MGTAKKRVLISGANKGIGLATVRAVLEARDDTFVWLGSRDRGRGGAARDALAADDRSFGDRTAVVAIDVSDDDSVAAAVEAVGKDVLYGVINNAGMGLGSESMEHVLNVNTRGPQRVCNAFIPLLDANHGRVVNVSSASGPTFVSKCSPERQKQFTNPDATWQDVEALMAECLAIEASGGSFSDAGFGGGAAYGLSKACLNLYTIALARSHPRLTVNACTPGFIETDLTSHYATGQAAKDMGMKPPAEGTKASLHLLLGDPGGTGWYFGSDAQRSPMDRYRSPGDPPYTGD